MNVVCSVCLNSYEGVDMHLYKSPLLPGARYIACDECKSDGLFPRPHIILGIKYGIEDLARTAITSRLYYGDEIKASEIIDLS